MEGAVGSREEPDGVWRLLEKVALVALCSGRGAAAGVEGRGQVPSETWCPVRLEMVPQCWAVLLRA